VSRILVLGGTGFIGRHVVRRLASGGHAVTVFHRGVHEPELASAVRHVRHASAAIPMRDFPPALTGERYDVVLHMVPIGEADAVAARRSFAGSGRLVAVSSGDVYRAWGRLIGLAEPPDPPGAPGPRDPLPEDAPLRQTVLPYGPRTDSPWGPLEGYDKILVERAFLEDGGPPATILRLPKVYGPGDGQRSLGAALRRMVDGRPAILLSESQAGWRWTHGYVEDVAAAIALAALDDRAAGRVYNVGEEPTPTTAERVAALGRAVGWPGRVVVVPDALLPRHLRWTQSLERDLAYDTRRIRGELGWAEVVPADEAARRTYAWEREHPPEEVVPGEFDYGAEDAVLSDMGA